MQYLAHRGQWTDPTSKNSLSVLTLALQSGFGIETDIRDQNGILVVSHDPPKAPSLDFSQLLHEYLRAQSAQTLALNVKADGIGKLLKASLDANKIFNYFCFDMSLPESLVYRRLGLRYFTRESEHETAPLLYKEAAGVWMDQFESEWIQPSHVRRHLDTGKQVALVSPELHGRDPISFWRILKEDTLNLEPNLMLCTDFPEKASKFFDSASR
jgi:glycerophosphoryl diester phosphodiesterase